MLADEQRHASPDADSSSGIGILRLLPRVQADGEPTDELVAQAIAGDRAAMHRLLAPWNDRIFTFLLALLRNSADAEDAAQETFLRAVKGLSSYEHRGEFKAWMYRIARNQAALTATRRKRIQSREEGMETELLDALPQTDVASEDDRAEGLLHAVDELPAAEREVVRLRLEEDLKFREIAERTGAPLNTVLGRMRNAMRRLHEALSNEPTS